MQKKRILFKIPIQILPWAPSPKGLAGRSSRSDRAYFAAATIFILFVIFCMFLTDFNRIETAIQNKT